MQLVLFHPVPQRFQRKSLVPLTAGVSDQQAFAQRGAEGIHHISLAVGILFHQFLGGNHGGLVSSGKTGGESKYKGILTCPESRLDRFFPSFGVNGGGGGNVTGTQTVIKFFNSYSLG